MNSVGILPAYTGTVVSDALCAYRQYRQSHHAPIRSYLSGARKQPLLTALELAFEDRPVPLTL
jgi:hypothetical protein